VNCEFPALLNVGCGTTFHPGWTNLDLASTRADVVVQDIRKGISYPNQSFDAVYSSHLLEHLSQGEAFGLVGECFRVLKVGGILRVVVPDLEAIVRTYLNTLEALGLGNSQREADYDWMMLELYDQTVRSKSGGEMARYLASPGISNKEFIVSRIGLEANNFWKRDTAGNGKSVIGKIKEKGLPWLIHRVRNDIARMLVRLVAGAGAYRAFDEGLFRHSGEIHRWMYDRYSLCRLLTRCGFVNVADCKAGVSRIPDYGQYELDVVNGRIRKPDSLFMEAIRP
jgi:SAM-dependent methyltransferase